MDLHVSNMPKTATEIELRALIGRMVKVEAVKMLVEGEALVSFATEQEAERALKEFDGYEMGGRLLSVRYALPRRERENRLESGRD